MNDEWWIIFGYFDKDVFFYNMLSVKILCDVFVKIQKSQQRYFEKLTFMIYTSEMYRRAFQKERIWNVGYISDGGVEIRRSDLQILATADWHEEVAGKSYTYNNVFASIWSRDLQNI